MNSKMFKFVHFRKHFFNFHEFKEEECLSLFKFIIGFENLLSFQAYERTDFFAFAAANVEKMVGSNLRYRKSIKTNTVEDSCISLSDCL